MIKPPKLSLVALVLAPSVGVALGFVAASTFEACTPTQQAKFVDAANLVCSGLEEYEVLHNEILSIDLLMQRGEYQSALKVAYALLDNIDETKDLDGVAQLRALILLLESIVKDPK